MGIFTGIGLVTPDASRYKKAVRSLENKRAASMIYNAQAGIDFREKEDPREQAQLKSSMWGRGLGKSSINDQNAERLTMIQGQRNEKLRQALDYAYKYRTMINKKHHWEKVSQYYEMIDGIIGLASGVTRSASTNAPEGGGGDFGGGGWGGDFNSGGNGGYA